MRLAFTIPGDARGKGRPKPTARGGVARLYTDAKTASYENLVALAGEKALGGRSLLDEPLRLAVRVRICPPASASAKKRAEMLATPHSACRKPDTDNVIKAVLDGLNKVVFRDDVLITGLAAEKVWAETPGVDVVISTYPKAAS